MLSTKAGYHCDSSERATGTLSESPRAPTGRRVLIIDDELPIRDVVSRLLRRFGHAVKVAANGDDALALARADAFDIIICDLNMPGLSGLDVYGALQREHLLGDARFTLATGNTTPLGSVESAERERLSVLTKPFELARLLDLVTSLPTHSAPEGSDR